MTNLPLHKIFIGLGIVFFIAGILWYFFSDKLHWLGKLPGDFRYEGENSRFYFPLTTMLLISAIINLILWLIRKFF
jgi:hypothetical protein